MNLLVGLPLQLRLGGIFILGLIVASFLNWAVYSWAWNARPISPWSRDAKLKRRWCDRLPVVGWWLLRRESHVHGTAFWLRPLLVELGFASAVASLYWWETVAFGSAPPTAPAAGPAPAGHFVTADVLWFVHLQFIGHAVLLALMIVASLIDLDEKTIPDLLTVPGTLLGLALATATVWCLPGNQTWISGPALQPLVEVEFLELSAPNAWPPSLAPTQPMALLLGLGCWLLWCFALLPRVWRARRGHGTAAAIFFRHLRREPWTRIVCVLAVVGAVLVALVWWFGAAAAWAALLTSLIGLAVGGGCIWVVRLVGTGVLGKEAMGFGDVTLMGMIGAFLGWQPCLFIFFIAPFAGLVLGVSQWLLRRDSEIPYGPFLCLATCCVVLSWPRLWHWGMDMFAVGWLVPSMMLICALLLVVLLGLLQLVKRSLGMS